MTEIVGEMLHSQDKWSAVCVFANSVLLAKEAYEREIGRTLVDPHPLGLLDWDSDAE